MLDLVPTALVPDGARLYPVGRLDQDSEGLLAPDQRRRLGRTGPPSRATASSANTRSGCGRRSTREQLDALEAGHRARRGPRGARAACARSPTPTRSGSSRSWILRPPPLAWYRATLTQGWKRQLRRMFARGRSARRPPRPRSHRTRADRRAALRARPVAQGARDPRTRRRRRSGPANRGPVRPRTSRSDPEQPVSCPGCLRLHRDRRALVVALDGPGSSGKSSVGAAAARELGYRFFDTGLLYRAITWLALDRGVGSRRCGCAGRPRRGARARRRRRRPPDARPE